MRHPLNGAYASTGKKMKMPLRKGKSEKTFSDNLRELAKANASKPADEKRPLKQRLAIAYAQKRKG